jgi:uncharacterized FAD-dependent dehydrogenase
LWSQIKDPRHLGRKVLTEFVKAGAPPEILTEAHPHIGTFRLVTMVESMRATIEALGGEYRFQSRVDDVDVETAADGARRVRGLHLHTGDYIAVEQVVLAIGHSARDTFAMLHDRGVHIEAKPFSIKQGVYKTDLLPRVKSPNIHMQVDWKNKTKSQIVVLKSSTAPINLSCCVWLVIGDS